MPDILERKPEVSDEVSAIELAAICVKRWRLLLAVLVMLVAGVLGYVLTVERQYEFQSLYSLASWDDDRYVIDPDSTVALLNGKVWPELKAQYEADGSEALEFDVSVNKVSGTSLIRVTSYAGERNAAAVTAAHQELLSNLRQEESAKEASLVSSLEKRVSELEAYAEKIEQRSLGGNQVVPIYEELMASRARLESFISGGVQVLAAQSSRPAGIGHGLLLLAGLIGGIFCGVISTFVAEFFSRVRLYLIDSKER